MAKGFYLGSLEQVIGKDKDQTKLVKHTLVDVFDVQEREDGTKYQETPIVREVYLKPGVLKPLASGTAITFDYERKMKRTNDGHEYEQIVCANIKPVAKA